MKFVALMQTSQLFIMSNQYQGRQSFCVSVNQMGEY